MQKICTKAIALLMACAMLFSTVGAAEVASDETVMLTAGEGDVRASYQLDSYSVSLHDMKDGRLRIIYDVWGTHYPMDCVGAKSVVLQEEVAPGKWVEYTSFTDRYTYGSMSHAETLYVKVFPGVNYRAKVTAYARDSRGSDTGTVTSYVVCAS